MRRAVFIWLFSGIIMQGMKALAAEATRTEFGALADGTPVEAVELSNANGVRARIITLGATLQALYIPDRDGRAADVVLGYATAREYLEKPQYFGVTVGRYANRIAGGRFQLEGRTYTLETNDGPNHLHGGARGFDKALWKIDSVTSGQEARVTLSHVSPDGDSGYPGELRVTTAYSLNDLNELTIEYRARTNKPTIVNLTNHSYFNLAGEDSTVDALDHRLTLFADAYTPVDQTLIPTGERRPVEGSAFDFRKPRAIGERIRDASEAQLLIARGYDHNFIVNGSPGTLRPAARLEDPASGRILEFLITAPAVQFYSGNFLNGTTAGKSGRIYRQSDAVCLEPQTFPDSPNRPDFPSARLDPGQEYVSTMVLRFPGVKR
ncbi:MAG TPA: aldose epimerase family protein [Steroidobacteraceae bacterium]